ncbi:MAG: prephenate dehydrogenase/arogenate dehydrogenase family protein [Deltaproteobacteria bacterium]|nr:prephenate dehydrogenase/arogenate dehydrogenase family protein [Deltaproteobacteria bacterium]
MEGLHIGIIGGTGGMGRIFAALFRGEGYTVHCAGRTTGPDIPAMAETCQVIIVSVPIGITVQIIEEVGPLMGDDALLMDLTSLKAEPVKAMLRASPAEVIGLHPLFGPGVEAVAGHIIGICPARTERWLDWVRDIFKKHGAIVVETTPERHDEMMTLVQALNHLNSITMGMIMKEWGVDLEEVERFTTPIFTQKLAIIKELFTNNPRLYADIITLNPYIDTILDLYEKTLSEVRYAIKHGDAETFTKLMETRSLWSS